MTDECRLLNERLDKHFSVQLYGPEKEQAVLEARLLVVMVLLHFLQPNCDQDRLQRGCDRNMRSCVSAFKKKSLLNLLQYCFCFFFFFFGVRHMGSQHPS